VVTVVASGVPVETLTVATIWSPGFGVSSARDASARAEVRF